MQEHTIIHRSGAIAAIVVFVAAGSVMARAQQRAGCETAVDPIQESRDFTPQSARLTHLPDLPIMTTGQRPTSANDRVDGLELRWAAGDGERSLYRYFFSREVDRDLTAPPFWAAGGVQLDRDAVIDGNPYTADDVIAQVGDRAVKVEIADYDGALVWADPASNGVRPHHLYWSDGTYNFALIAQRSPERMVQLGREIACT